MFTNLLFIMFPLILIGCGEENINSKIYKVAIINSDQPSSGISYARIEAISDQLDSINSRLGRDIFFISDQNNSNSTFLFKNLDGSHIGYGAPTKQVTQMMDIPNNRRIIRNNFGMNLQFDIAYFDSNLDSNLDNIEKLILHEIGHGVGMPHIDDISSIMYPTITSNTKDTEEYFTLLSDYIDNFHF